MSAHRAYSQYGTYLVAGRPRVSDIYVHQQRVRSHFRKQVSAFQFAVRVLTLLALLFGVVQLVRSLSMDLYRLPALISNHGAVDRYYSETVAENNRLQKRIAVSSSPAGVEALARNKLEMVGPSEVLVRLHMP